MQKRLISLLVTVTIITACSAYRPEIQQGNIVAEDMLAQLKPGMTKRQVTFVMGTPLIIDPFRTDRWDYVYQVKNGDAKVIEQKRLTLHFDADTLARIERGDTP